MVDTRNLKYTGTGIEYMGICGRYHIHKPQDPQYIGTQCMGIFDVYGQRVHGVLSLLVARGTYDIYVQELSFIP